MSMIAFTAVALASLSGANAQWCYNRYGGRYRCNGGLSYGARIGIGVGIAAGILLLFLLCGYWKRRALRKRFQHFKPPPLPYHQNGNQPGPDQGYNPYVNNPPPPQSNNSYNGGVQSPPATYQPSMAGQYGHQQSYRGETGGNNDNNDHEHGYEWEQAREQERIEREGAQGAAPPAYDPTNMPVGGKSYAPPSGPPPSK